MIRRLKKDVLQDLPPKSRHVVPIPLSNPTEYLEAELDFISWLSKAPKVLLLLDGDQPGRKAASAIANILRHNTNIFIHYLPNDMEPEDLSDKQLISIVNKYLNFF